MNRHLRTIKTIENIKNQAMFLSANPSLIIRKEKQKLSIEAKLNLPSDEALTKTIKRRRYIENEHFRIPNKKLILFIEHN